MLDREEFLVELFEATCAINEEAISYEDTLRYVVEEVADRISIYLNLGCNELFDKRLVKIAARIANGIFTQTNANISGENNDTEIKSISDNGQSITYGDKARNYLATATDGELFGGFAELLKPYRRINVVSR